jgi:hypothetical protein
MAFQGDSKLFLTESGDMAVVGCMCSEVCHCGPLQLRRSNDPDDEYHMWMDVLVHPIWDWKWRLQQLWSLLLGRSIHVGLSGTARRAWLSATGWKPRPTPEEMTQNFRAIKAWYEAGMPEIIAGPPGEPCPACEGTGRQECSSVMGTILREDVAECGFEGIRRQGVYVRAEPADDTSDRGG